MKAGEVVTGQGARAPANSSSAAAILDVADSFGAVVTGRDGEAGCGKEGPRWRRRIWHKSASAASGGEPVGGGVGGFGIS